MFLVFVKKLYCPVPLRIKKTFLSNPLRKRLFSIFIIPTFFLKKNNYLCFCVKSFEYYNGDLIGRFKIQSRNTKVARYP